MAGQTKYPTAAKANAYRLRARGHSLRYCAAHCLDGVEWAGPTPDFTTIKAWCETEDGANAVQRETRTAIEQLEAAAASAIDTIVEAHTAPDASLRDRSTAAGILLTNLARMHQAAASGKAADNRTITIVRHKRGGDDG